MFSLKCKVKARREGWFPDLVPTDFSFDTTVAYITRCAQMEDYSEIFAGFSDPSSFSNPLINLLNLTLDHNA